MDKTRIEIIQGDITRSDADAIANAANTALLGRSCSPSAAPCTAVRPERRK